MKPTSWAEFVVDPPQAHLGKPTAAAQQPCTRLVRWSSLVVLAASLLVLLSHCWEYLDSAGRYAGIHELLQGVFAADMTPVAFSTALSFFLCGLALLLSAAQPMTRGRRLIVQGASGLVIGWGLYVVLAFVLGGRVALPTDGSLPDAFGNTPMSAFTAAIFVVAGVAMWSMLGKSNRLRRASASIGVCVLGLVNLLILLAYAYQIQLLKDALNLNVAVAPLTALAFLVLDVGMIGALGPSCFPLRPFVGASPRAVMLRSFLPVVVCFLMLDAWVRGAILHGDPAYKHELVLYSAALCLVSVVVTTLAVGSISVRIGARIEKAEARRDEALHQMAGTIDALRKTREQLEQANQQATEANRDLALARDKAEQLSVAKDFFLATVSHELRTPLNHVIGYLQLLEMAELDDDQRRDLSKIHNAADNLLALVNDLLDYQKMLQGALTLEPTSFDLAPWVEDLADAMRPKVGERGNKLVVDCPVDMGALEADEKRARQALTNLLSNAAKFTRDGVVTLGVRRERDGDNEWVRLDVRDTGRGMTEADQTKLFQPFTKLLSRTENPEGTGLGLALSQRLCRLMGGDLTLSYSEPGRGSTFTIRLPATPAAVGAPPPAPPRPVAVVGTPNPAPRPTVILVIDDDPEVRELMRRHMEGQGFIVHLASSGAEGLEMVKRLEPDAITLDVLMPGIDGWGTLAALQADAETADIPVILITMLDDRTRGFALGAWEVLTKPISWSRLIDLLRNIEPNTGPVLLVDDDAAFRELAERTLNRHGWEVCGVGDGRAGLAAAARRRPALVLLDLLMPGMDGFEFLEAFRQDPSWRDVPVVVVTAKHLTAEDHRRLDGSVLRILPKGMSSLDDLLREVERLLQNPTEAASPEPETADAAEQPA